MSRTLEEFLEIYDVNYNDCADNDDAKSHIMGIKAVVEACEPRWISVEERLPVDKQKIWFKTKKYSVVAGTVVVDTGITFVNPEGKRDSFSFKTLSITHWMPALPESPTV